jgi:hypothetical protein
MLLYPLPILIIVIFHFIKQIINYYKNRNETSYNGVCDYNLYFFFSSLFCFFADIIYLISIEEPTDNNSRNVMQFQTYSKTTIIIHIYYMLQILSRLFIIVPIILEKNQNVTKFAYIVIFIGNSLILSAFALLLIFILSANIDLLNWGIIFLLVSLLQLIFMMLRYEFSDKYSLFNCILYIFCQSSISMATYFLLMYSYIPIHRKYFMLAYWISLFINCLVNL